MLVEVTTESPDSVFEALETTSRAFLEIRDQHPDLEAIELLTQTANRSRGGQFLLNSDNAPLIVNEHISVQDFFMEYVEF